MIVAIIYQILKMLYQARSFVAIGLRLLYNINKLYFPFVRTNLYARKCYKADFFAPVNENRAIVLLDLIGL